MPGEKPPPLFTLEEAVKLCETRHQHGSVSQRSSFPTDTEMNEVSETCSLDDDMVDGDLGDGMGVRTAPSSTRSKSESFAGPSENLLLKTELLKCSSRAGEADWLPAMKTAETQQRARWKLPRFSSLVDLSKDELKERLQEATEMIDVLCCELDVTHRYLEGKYEALKILQGKAILDKATTHTKSLLQKSEEKAKALEKEVNSLQWELSFLQVQMKKSEQSWECKYNRMSSENKILTNSLQEIESENQQLRAENSALSQQYLELLSMLNVKEQRIYQATKPQYSLKSESSVLELTVLGACQCLGATEACPCSRTAAATRKQLVQLQQERIRVWDAGAAILAEMLRSPFPPPPPPLEGVLRHNLFGELGFALLDAQHSRKEEALMVADAFRIAFEQQLRKRSEDFLLLAETNIQKSNHCKAEGANRSPLISVSKKLKALLPSSLEIKMRDELLETLYRLQDLLNDKEEALAHQRKVSIMLAHSADELQRQLHLGSNYQLQDLPESTIQLKQPQDPSGNQSHSQKTSDTSESEERTASMCKVQNQLNRELPASQLQQGQPPHLSESRTETEEV